MKIKTKRVDKGTKHTLCSLRIVFALALQRGPHPHAEPLRARRETLAARHDALLHEPTELRASEAFALAQADEAARAAYAATNRAAPQAKRDRLRQQLTQLQKAAAV